MGRACLMLEIFQICLSIYSQSPWGLQKKFRQNEVSRKWKKRKGEGEIEALTRFDMCLAMCQYHCLTANKIPDFSRLAFHTFFSPDHVILLYQKK